MKLFQGVLIVFGSLFFLAGIVMATFFVPVLKRSFLILTITLIFVGIGLIFVAYRMNKQVVYREDSKVVDTFLTDTQNENDK